MTIFPRSCPRQGTDSAEASILDDNYWIYYQRSGGGLDTRCLGGLVTRQWRSVEVLSHGNGSLWRRSCHMAMAHCLWGLVTRQWRIMEEVLSHGNGPLQCCRAGHDRQCCQLSMQQTDGQLRNDGNPVFVSKTKLLPYSNNKKCNMRVLETSSNHNTTRLVN